MLYNFVRKDQPDSGGTRDYAFLSAFTNPLFTLVGGATPYPVNRWPVMQPEQVYYNMIPTAQGLEGIVAGQIALQQLTDTRFTL